MKLKGSTVLLAMVYLTNGLVESVENLEKMWELTNLIRDCELPFICMGDWNMTPEEMQTTELASSIGAVTKTLVAVEYTCTSGNRLLDCALVNRRLASVVKLELCWAVPCKSRIALEVTVCRAPRTHTIEKRAYQKSAILWEMKVGTKIGPHDKGRRMRPSVKRGNDTAAPSSCMEIRSQGKHARKWEPRITVGQLLLRNAS